MSCVKFGAAALALMSVVNLGGCAATVVAPEPVVYAPAPAAVVVRPAPAVVVRPAPLVVVGPARRNCGWVVGRYGRLHRTWRCY